jgi:hypothetical protein
MENTQVNPDSILQDQQVHKDVLRLAGFKKKIIVAGDPKPSGKS